jgi:hypothetical protein
VVRAQSTLELLRLAVAAAVGRLADSDAVALAASDAAAAAADAQRRAAPDDTSAAEAMLAAVSALDVAECNCEAAADELEAAEAAADACESYEGVLGDGDDADDASDEPAPAAGTAAPSPPPGSRVYGVHLFGGTGASALALLCICTLALFYVDISGSSQAMLSLAMAAGLIPCGEIWPDIRTVFTSKEFQAAVDGARASGGYILFTAGWPCQVRRGSQPTAAGP